MSYIAFDLDAFNKCPLVARAAGVSEDSVIGGLMRLWTECFRSKSDSVDSLKITGAFGGLSCVPALLSFGFLEATGETYRVKGASRYLRVRTAQSNGGKMSSKNLIPGAVHKKNRGGSRRGAEGEPKTTPREPEEPLGLLLGPTPSTDYRAPTTESKSIAPKQPAPRASDEICSDFKEAIGEAYAWNGAKDGVALAALMKFTTLEEIRERWRKGLRETGWLHTATVAQLRSKWNDLATGRQDKQLVDHGMGQGSGPIVAVRLDP